MARPNRIKKSGDAHYHVISRTNNRAFLFTKGSFKTKVIDLLNRCAEFSGIILEAYCLMDNHFHLVCKVVKPDDPVPELEILRRIAILKGQEEANAIAEHWAELRRIHASAAVDDALKAWRVRMNDLSEFTKTFKQLTNNLYKASNPYVGSIWSGRFSSTLIQDGQYLATCIRYVEYNPLRARLVTRARDYAWSSHNADSPAFCAPFAGPGPAKQASATGCEISGEMLMKRIPQLGEGKLFGSYEFVRNGMYAFGHCFQGRPVARPVIGNAYATHGHRIAG